MKQVMAEQVQKFLDELSVLDPFQYSQLCQKLGCMTSFFADNGPTGPWVGFG